MVKSVFYKNFSGYTMENGLKRDRVDVGGGACLWEHYRSLVEEVMMVVEVKDH